MTQITVARIYVTEAEHNLKEILRYLHDEAKVTGVTVFRGIMGFGASGVMHQTRFVDLSLDLPLVIEFFDLPDRIDSAIAKLPPVVEIDHVITWSATRLSV